jgi:hypothetical protein
MKPVKAFILLFAFLTGAIQPIVPLLEYHFFKESIMELFCENRNVPDSDCDGICYLTNQIEATQERQSESKAAFADYYPGTILYERISAPFLYPHKPDSFLNFDEVRLKQYQDIELPPPVVSRS